MKFSGLQAGDLFEVGGSRLLKLADGAADLETYEVLPFSPDVMVRYTGSVKLVQFSGTLRVVLEEI